MGRSKFPGKPSKHVNRKRVNVLPPTPDAIIESSRSMTAETDAENKQARDEGENNKESVPSNNALNTKVSLRRRLNRKLQGSKSLLTANTSKRNIMSKICNKAAVKGKITTTGSRKSLHSYTTMKNITKPCRTSTLKESNNLVGKFVLPSRSVHSSRVIKPNKRFINVDLSDTLTLKKKVINKRHCIKQDETPAETSTEGNIANTKPFSNGRVVLRQARLKLHTQTPSGTEGPFSCNSTSGSPPGTVTCGVCGAVRFYRFVKQARKFNIYSCESCRKFISKMIKRQQCGKNVGSSTLVCHKGQGMCHVPPIVRSQQMKLIRCAYKARCPACWLKMCLRSFQMPMSLKHSLVQLLPKNMQGSDVIFNNSLPLLWQGNTPNIDSGVIRDQETKPSETVKQRPVRFKSKPEANLPHPANSDIKRQKIDLKGPRVKHVCRSASIVLGQPLATFPGDGVEKKADAKEIIVVEPKKVERNDVEVKEATVKSSKSESNISENESSDSDKLPKLPLAVSDALIAIKRDKNLRIPAFTPLSLLSEANKNSMIEKRPKPSELQNTVSIDYWENYDLDDISQNGFCLIASQQFPMPAICFLCGSAGRESLLHCSLCCEPYHPFCLEQSPPVTNNNNRQFVWLCPRCTTCSACKQTDRQKIYCQRCSKAYHPECFSTKFNSEERPVVCSECLTCKNCGRENSTSFVGNIPLCLECFKIRRKGSMCPICRDSYDEIDTGEKVMECDQCKKWIHAKCEGLSEECYQILSILPESVRYSCCLCSKESPPYWRKVVESELRFNFNQVLRLLSKNKLARSVLKLSPLNNYSISLNKTVTQVKKIQFSDDDDDDISIGCDNDYSESGNDNDARGIESKVNLLDVNISYSKGDSDSPKDETKPLSMLDIKNKLNSNEYSSLRDFNNDMEEALSNTHSDELLNIYHVILRSVFPWYKACWSENKTDSDSMLKIQSPSITNHSQDVCAQSECITVDLRYCSFCKSIGDGLSHLESRLLYCGQNEWVHVNCALWSSEVYEEIDGSLQNVHSALSRGRLMRCSYCKQKGATIGCCFKSCCETYHFICARTAKCHFMHDKTMYCFCHELPKDSSVIISPLDFDIRRSVFVEVSDCNKKGKFSQIDKVNVMVGSLCVTNLGKINPIVSDNVDAIIPTGYVCSRLFWSTVEPWKLVSYRISTSILNAHVNTLFVDKNFTVDHTLSRSVVERKLKEILHWQKDIDKKKSDLIEFEDEEEPQNGADLLSPEITDAIFEELPHELLDGISVQDIFPKLMSYEDFINTDCKSDTSHFDGNDVLKKSDADIENLAEFDISSSDKDSKKSDLDIMDKLSRNKNQQRSCSLTLSCKLDNSFSPTMKKRKIAPRDSGMFFQLLQVDGNFDDSSSSECGSPTGLSHNDVWNTNLSEEPVTCERCHCTYRTQASYKRHLDACEVICSSESDSELNNEQDCGATSNNIELALLSAQSTVDNSPLLMNSVEASQPVVLASYESYQNEIHTSVLNTQTFVTASKSTSELMSVPQPEVIIPQMQNVQKATVEPVPCNLQQIRETPINSETFTVTQPTISVNEPISIANSQPTQFCLNQTTVPLCMNQPLTIQPNATISVNPGTSLINTTNPLINQTISINQAGSISLNQPTTIQPSLEFQSPAVTIQPLQYSNNITPIINMGSQNQIAFGDKLIAAPNIINSMVAQGITVPSNRWVKPIGKPTLFATKSPKCNNNKGRGRSIAAKRPLAHYEDSDAIIIPQTNTSAPSVIVQHLPSTSFIPSFVDAFQQQTGQNLQYVATISPQFNSTVHPQSVVHLQADNNLISLLPGVQPTMIIQQPRVLENQLIMDSNGSLSWAPQPVQPVYYGFETIVQNTVMQSQQFLPTTVPGVLTANSSYSTTTQVFQTSKLEPVLDVATNSFVLLNPGQLMQSQPIEVPQNTQPQIINTVASNIVHNKEIRPPTIKYSTPSFEKSATVTTTTANANSITLPTAPFVPEQGIPTNVVTPTPKLPTSAQSRPMSRVLPMQTLKDTSKIKIQLDKQEVVGNTMKGPTLINKITEPVKDYEKNNPSNKITGKNPIEIRMENNQTQLYMDVVDKNEPLKMIFQKESPTGTYKVSNNVDKCDVQLDGRNLIERNEPLVNIKMTNIQMTSHESPYKIPNNFSNNKQSSVQIAPLKPIKSNFGTSPPAAVFPLADKQNRQPDKSAKKITAETPPPSKHVPQEKKENENVPAILYTIETQDGFKYSSTSVAELWAKVFEAVQNARAAHNMPPLPPDSTNIMNSLQILGLKTPGLKYLIEQLPGASKCSKYKPSFHFISKYIDSDEEPVGHTNGCARCVPNIKRNDPYDMFGWLASKHRKPEHSLVYSDLVPRRGSINNLPMAMRFRQLKLTSKYSVGVYRSQIHRRGLFCLRDFEAGEMVIEYSGEVIRSILTDKREKFYNSKGIGCYMFRIDDNLVVDATMTGNAARFINHSCDPNCYSKVVEILGHKHIIIFALRRIICGEELTYDYKFPIEEDKIPCTCGTRRCRKFLN